MLFCPALPPNLIYAFECKHVYVRNTFQFPQLFNANSGQYLSKEEKILFGFRYEHSTSLSLTFKIVSVFTRSIHDCIVLSISLQSYNLIMFKTVHYVLIRVHLYVSS